MIPAVGADFLDIREHGFARVAACVPDVRVADPAFNIEAHLRVLGEVHAAGAHYAACPGLGLSAYSCGDLFFQEPLLQGAVARSRASPRRRPAGTCSCRSAPRWWSTTCSSTAP
jgi:NAD+ synthase (glutamine-hydrolysing)